MCAERHPTTPPRRGQRGASIVELMVGMVVALLVGLTAATSAMVFNASQRQAMGGGLSTVQATTALASMKEDLSQAGLGFFDSRLLCNSLNLSVNGSNLSQAAFAPVQVTRTNGVDRIDTFYASQVAGGTAVRLAGTSNLASATLETYLPATAGQAVLLAPEQGTGACTVRTVTTNTPFTDPAKQVLTFANTGLHNQVAFAAPLTYPADSVVSLLGTVQWQRYQVVDGALVLDRPMATTNTRVTLARDVVALRVQYGVAPANETSVTEWVAPEGSWATLEAGEIERVRAVRIGLVTRSASPEKPNPNTGECEAWDRNSPPQVLGFTTSPAAVGSTPWYCYRYRTSVVVVPMRNVVLGV